MFIDLDMMHIEETNAASKKQQLMQEDIAEIIAWQGDEAEALKKLNITREQFRYIRKAYDPKTLRLNYREDMETVYYE